MFLNIFIPNENNDFYPYSIRKSALTVYVVLLFLFNLFAGILLPGVSDSVSASSITANNLVVLTNNERSASGLATLNYDGRLAAAANAKANDMLSKDYWDHFGPNGETPWQFISAAGYGYVYAGENLAKGFSTAEGVHQAWMASPTHRANIMNGNYRDIGIAVVSGELAGEDVILVVQMFGSLSADPAPAPAPAPEPAPVKVETPQPVQVEEPLPVQESGQIKSISIQVPKQDEVVTDPAIDVVGTVDGYESNMGSYTVVLNRGGQDIASTESNETKWVIDKKSDWEQGNHDVEVYLEDDDGVSSQVKFLVDSVPPLLKAENLNVTMDGNHAELTVLLNEEDAEVYLNVESETYAFAHQADGVYTAYVPESLVTGSEVKGTLIVSDQYGNSTELDVSDRIIAQVSNDVLQPVVQESFMDRLLGGLGSLSVRGIINLIFAIGLFSLLILQVYFYRKRGMLKEKGGYVMTVGVFLFIILVGLFTEVSGVIS